MGPFWALGGLGLDVVLINALIVLLVCTSFVGSIGGLAQVQFRPLLGYSSLGQTGWIGLIVLLDMKVFLFYVVLYSILLIGLLFCLYVFNHYRVVDVPGAGEFSGLVI